MAFRSHPERPLELTVEIAVISDTHMPRGNRRLPEACVDRLKQADLIIHAGDLSRLSVLIGVQDYGPVIAVYGNVDDEATRAALPETATVDADGATIAIVHDAGPRPGRLARLRTRFPQAQAVVFGHSHLPLHERHPATGFQIFNPGSPTERRHAPQHTMGIAHATAGELTFELIALG
jgi:putative phosphoesterase